MCHNEEHWDKMIVLTLCALDLDTRKEILKHSQITLPEILEQVSDWGQIWTQENLNGHDLRPLKLPISKWLEKYDNPIKEKALYAFSTMKINYVFQMYAFKLLPKYCFLDEFKKHFSTKEEIELAMAFIERARKESKIPPIAMMSWMEEDLFWVRKTWGM